jgi:histidinol-phosphatase (PHP family)
MKRYRIDLHNHTTRCNHATGTVDEYIQKAISLGIDIYGFSEHAPMDFDKKYRISFEEMSSYESEIVQAKERYKDSIDIRLGYEVDFLPEYIDDRVLNAKVDYLIGSVHFLDKWGFDNPEFIGQWQSRDIDDIYKEYFEAISAMAKSGLFDIVGHFDLIKVFKFLPKADIKILAKDALREIKKSDMILEINSAGVRKPIGEAYPSKSILELAYEMDIPITFGSDAHSVEQVGFAYEIVLSMAKEIGYSKAVTFKNRDREMFKI